MKAIYPDIIESDATALFGTVQADSENASFPATNVLNDLKKKSWKSASEYGKIFLPIQTGTNDALGLHGIVADDLIFHLYQDTDGSNLVLNPSFETAGAGPPVFLNWDETVGDGAIAQDATTFKDGTKSCKLTAGASADTIVKQSIGITASKRYKIVFWTRGDGTNAGRYQIRYFNGATTVDLVATTTTGVTGATWTKITHTILAPGDATQFRLFFRCPTFNTGIAYFDIVSILIEYTDPTYGTRREFDLKPSGNGTDLVLNGGFETAGAGGADVFANWDETVSDGAIVQDSTFFFRGSESCKLTSGASKDTRVRSHTTNITPGKKYYASFWTMGDGTNDGRYQVWYLSSDTGGQVSLIGSTQTGVTGRLWERVTFSFTLPSAAADLRFFLFSPDLDTGFAYFDTVEIYEEYDEVNFTDQWIDYTSQANGVTLEVETLAKDGDVATIGVTRANEAYDWPEFNFPISETRLDKGFILQLRSGDVHYKFRQVVRRFSGTILMTRLTAYDELMRAVVANTGGVKPISLNLTDESENNWTVFGRMSPLPVANHLITLQSEVTLNILEVV